jgi:hypothetical protein
LVARPSTALTFALIAWGIVLRYRGFFFSPVPLWEDEAAWAIRLMEWPLSDHLIRPIGFMATVKLLAKVFAPSELVLRAIPWAAGLAALLLVPVFAARLFRTSAARVVFVAVIALHPAAIDLAKEFKPYSLGFALHLLALLAALEYAQHRRRLHLLVGLALGTLGVLLSQDLVFTYPVLFGVLGFSALKHSRAHVLGVVVALAASLCLLLVLRASVYRNAGGGGDEQYWGGKYDVFYIEADAQGASRLGWTAARHADLAAMAGMRRELWKLPESAELRARAQRIDRLLWIALSAFGCGTLLYQRRIRLWLLLTTPLLFTTIANALGYWPLGAFRTNLFALSYYAALAACAFDWDELDQRTISAVPALGLVLMPYLALGPSGHFRKDSSMTSHASFTRAAQKLIELQGPARASPELLALDGASCQPWRYYTEYHPRRDRAAELQRRFEARCAKTAERMARIVRRALKSEGSRAYLLASSRENMASLTRELERKVTIDERQYVGKRDALVLKVSSHRATSD